MVNLSPDDLADMTERFDINKLNNEYGGPVNLCKSLNSDPQQGLNNNQALNQNLSSYGHNDLPVREIKTFCEIFLDAISDKTLIILIICAILSLILEVTFASPEERSTSWIDGGAILIAVAIVSIVQTISNSNQEKQFAAVNRIKSIFKVTVIRYGHTTQVQNLDIVVGDVVILEPGDKIPADGVILTSEDLYVDQSVASGESEAVLKSETDPFLIGGTHVSDGRGSFLVTSVGTRTQQGKALNAIANEESRETPLTEKLSVLAEQIGYLGMGFASLAFICILIPWIYHEIKLKQFSIARLREPLDMLVVSLTIVVCAVPEGLPLAVTISLAYSMRRMMTDNNFVRRLEACETMGSATVILTDKTGTLTKNEMNIERMIIAGSVTTNLPSKLREDKEFMSNLVDGLVVNSHAILDGASSIGNQTECALLRFSANALRIDWQNIRNNAKILHCFQFDRIRKLMSTIIQNGNDIVVHTKGAPDLLLPKCTKFYNDDGLIKEMTENNRNFFQQKVIEEGKQSFRTIALAYKKCPTKPLTANDAENDLILLAIFSIRDTIRPNTQRSISAVKNADIRVVMLTGDHPSTAAAIATDVGILENGYKIITGSELNGLKPSDVYEILKDVSVVARSTPLDKHMIVNAFKQAGEIVAVTGDGTNDVPALMAADVGLAMGKSGTELAKEASDICILDDDFRSIVRSVVWGRGISNNIRRFLQFQLTANVVTLIISTFDAIYSQTAPFKAVQLLWVNLIMDSLGALSLATGTPSDNLLNRPPIPPSSPLISFFMFYQISVQTIFQLLTMFVLSKIQKESETFVFTVFILSQAFNLFNCRAAEPNDSAFQGAFHGLFILIFLLICLIQIVLVEFTPKFFACEPLNLMQWICAFFDAAMAIPVGIIARYWFPKFRFLRSKSKK
ncbi:calcium-translocating P-type ATPase, PMCA-type family protein [Trichomonas vaginalis G3]|uniref:Calcium-transporting ATPase n=1 Tax=Trichomonas vaginalis (strain ATCC PRA-98 / G3) TaxID=412133 RepID=A2E1G4_TRIV3|nr:calcium-transporting ATPase protein [Trichomonas vaginalis G3]EAY13531.1 calcium-translocating P-type ATPase, PMCA-type family protein [Trichomonas vaginalis G3]KAI5529193.1 calcium-transporting ATPase protein [Trichomonas vaginalis G3]|eukprot:XP_001325754.1 calcium-translocating P-type ATPase, PMCA-type family protein [Trichomonas vaginalis G3]